MRRIPSILPQLSLRQRNAPPDRPSGSGREGFFLTPPGLLNAAASAAVIQQRLFLLGGA